MNELKRDFPSINRMFRKYCVIPATQNADERLFSMVARNTGPLCRSIKISTIEKKVVVVSASISMVQMRQAAVMSLQCFHAQGRNRDNHVFSVKKT